jgi:hypothetical protein
LPFNFQIGGRELLFIAARVFYAEVIERLSRARPSIVAKVAGVVIRQAHHIKPGLLEVFAVTGRYAKGEAFGRARRAFGRRAALEHRALEIAKGNIRF